MALLGIQILGVLFALFMLYLTFMHQKRKDFSSKEYALWAVVWIGAIIATLFPAILEPLTKTLRLTRNMDLIIIFGFIFLIGVSFITYTSLRKTQRKVESLVRKIAIEEEKK
jgi:hypothetical protein